MSLITRGQQDPNTLFTLTEQDYQQWLKPISLNEGFEPQTLVQFVIDLPFYFPVLGTNQFTISPLNQALCGYRLFEVTETRRMIGGTLDIALKRSSVEMIYVSSEKLTIEETGKYEEPTLTMCFDTLLATLNTFILSYILQTSHDQAHRISKDMLNVLAPFRLIDPHAWDLMEKGAFHLHMYAPYNETPIDAATIERIVNFIPAVRNQLNPFVVSQELYLAALRYRKTGFYREACIFAHTSVEGFLATLYDQFRISQGVPAAQAQQERRSIRFEKFIKTKFEPWLGGQWNTKLEASPCGQWWKHTYMVRNRVAHAGYFPTLTETATAIDAAQEFLQYIISLIKGKQDKYPAVAKYFFAPVVT